jgi:hypothetical protein
VRRATLPGVQSSDDNCERQSYQSHPKFFIFAGLVLDALGGTLLYRTWQHVCFDLSTNSNAAIDVTLIMVSALLIWIGMALCGMGFGIVGGTNQSPMREVSNRAATWLICFTVPIAQAKNDFRWIQHGAVGLKAKLGVMPSLVLVGINHTPQYVKLPLSYLLRGDVITSHGSGNREHISGSQHETSFPWGVSGLSTSEPIGGITRPVDILRDYRCEVRFSVGHSDSIGGYRGASVFEIDYHFQIEPMLRRKSEWLKQRYTLSGYPRTIGHSQSLIRSMSSVLSSSSGGFIRAIHFDRICSVNGKKNDAEQLCEGLSMVPKILFCLASNLAMCFGWWR